MASVPEFHAGNRTFSEETVKLCGWLIATRASERKPGIHWF